MRRERLIRKALMGGDVLLTPKEVRIIFRVSERTLRVWADKGRLPPGVRTAGGHRRYRAADVRVVLEEGGWA